MKRIFFLPVIIMCALSVANAQETSYDQVVFPVQQPPTLPQYGIYKSFDVTVFAAKPGADVIAVDNSQAYHVKLGTLAQVDSTGDFHIIGLVQRCAGKLTSTSSAITAITLTTSVYDKYGTLVKTVSLTSEQFVANFGRELSKDERQNQALLRGLIIEKALEASLQDLLDALNGAKKSDTTALAYLEKVKKKAELQDFETQKKALTPVLEKEGLAGFKNAAAPYVDYWVKMAGYTGENADEVKRAALQNLSVYYIAAGNIDKAKETIEIYKPIDKIIKELFGLIKYKNSEKLEKLIEGLNPPAPETIAAANQAVQSKSQVVDNYQYIVINGTVTVTDKKNAGTYNGIIKINKIPAASTGNIASLDPENVTLVITTTDDKGQPKIINTTISKVEGVKDNNGTAYIGQKFGSAVLGGSSYVFMKSTYSSAKITVYRTLLPAGGSDYVVRKAGDDKGIKSTMFSAKKTLIDYLADCPVLTEKLKNNTLAGEQGTIEKVAEAYTACQ